MATACAGTGCWLLALEHIPFLIHVPVPVAEHVPSVLGSWFSLSRGIFHCGGGGNTCGKGGVKNMVGNTILDPEFSSTNVYQSVCWESGKGGA